MRDVFGERMLRAHCRGADVGVFAGFGHGIVARVEVFSLLRRGKELVGVKGGGSRGVADFELVLEEVFLVGELAVEAEKLLLLFGQGLRVCCQRFDLILGGKGKPTLMSTLFF